jgi:hypothetical protein
MPTIKSIPLLYLWLSSSRYLFCLFVYHQVDTSAVFITIIKSYSRCIDLMIDINRGQVSTWRYSSIQQRYRLDGRHRYNRGIQLDTSAVLMPIIKSTPLLYWWLSSSRYLCCIYDYHQVDNSAVLMTIIKSIPLLYWWLSEYRRGIDLTIFMKTAEVSTWW